MGLEIFTIAVWKVIGGTSAYTKHLVAVTKKGLRKVYCKIFLLVLKVNILNECNLYECKEHILLLFCMKEGSFADTVNMIQLDETFHFMMSKCVHNVQYHLERMSSVFRVKYQNGERIVDRSGDHFNFLLDSFCLILVWLVIRMT